tara:strand:- start:1439 stop:2029 length:591 start_codon:yes stop_codon:yes gene_type:complete
MSKNDETDGLKTEAKILAATIEVETNKFSESFAQHKKALEAELTNLKELNVMLQSVPKKINAQFKETIPEIAKKLEEINNKKLNEIRSEYNTQAQEQIKSLNETEEKIRQLADNINKLSRKRIMRFFLGIIISSVISVGCATYAASYMMQTFPTRVTIDKPENIILYDSEVGLWGTDNVKVLKGLKKNDRKNKHKY